MYNNRVKRFVKLFEEEFPSLVKEYYNEFSAKYFFKYSPLSSIETSKGKVDLFTFIENYIQEKYNIKYNINRHFDFHSTSIFYAQSDDFGLTINSNTKDELPEQIKLNCLNEYGYLNDYGIFLHCFIGLSGLSNVIKKKIKDDIELECELIKLRMKSSLKRFFIQGQVKWQWIEIDQILHYGFDKFPNCLNNQFESLEYSIRFREKYGEIGEWDYGDDEDGYMIQNPYLDEKIRNLEDSYYADLKLKKPSDYTYRDVINRQILQQQIKEIVDTYRNLKGNEEKNKILLKSECKDLGEIPIIELRDNSNLIKEFSNHENTYYNYLKYRSKNSDTDVTPFEFPINIELDIKDVFNDETLIHEYLETFNEPENGIRQMFGLPKVGEGWVSETNLFYEIKTRFSKEVVIHHGRPSWLGKQHLDIYLPKFNIGVEYQGDQHYLPVDFFGGEESYKKNKVRDENKRQLCIKNSCHLIYVNPGYKLDDVINEIEKAMTS